MKQYLVCIDSDGCSVDSMEIKHPVADAGYGSYNYLFCEKNGMEKYMKFTMYEKSVKNEKYRTESSWLRK